MNYHIYTGHASVGENSGTGVLDRRTALLAASSLFIFGSFVGCAIYRLLGIGESELYDNLIERYFLALFYKCDGTLDIVRVVLDCCLHELWMFIAVFLAGFTLFTHAVSAALLLYRGMLLGFSMTMLQFSTRTGILLDSMVYLCASFAITMLLAVLCAHAACFYGANKTPRLKSPETLRYISVFLRVTALVCADIIAMLFLIYVYL